LTPDVADDERLRLHCRPKPVLPYCRGMKPAIVNATLADIRAEQDPTGSEATGS